MHETAKTKEPSRYGLFVLITAYLFAGLSVFSAELPAGASVASSPDITYGSGVSNELFLFGKSIRAATAKLKQTQGGKPLF
jgi:hypothetical protein